MRNRYYLWNVLDKAFWRQMELQWRHYSHTFGGNGNFRITGFLKPLGDGSDLREHLIHLLHFTDEMKTRDGKSCPKSHSWYLNHYCLLSITWWKMEHNSCGAEDNSIQATFIKHLLYTKHLTRCYWRHKGWWESLFPRAYESPVRPCFSIFLST